MLWVNWIWVTPKFRYKSMMMRTRKGKEGQGGGGDPGVSKINRGHLSYQSCQVPIVKVLYHGVWSPVYNLVCNYERREFSETYSKSFELDYCNLFKLSTFYCTCLSLSCFFVRSTNLHKLWKPLFNHPRAPVCTVSSHRVFASLSALSEEPVKSHRRSVKQ